MIKEALQWIVDTTVEKRFEGPDGRIYVSEKVVPIESVRPETMVLSTLAGFCDFANKLKEDVKELAIFIDNNAIVSLTSENIDEDGKYEHWAEAHAKPYLCNFRFGQDYDPERFAIELQTNFIKTPERDKLIAVCSSLTKESEHKVEDDGITQRTTVGRAVKTKITIENPVKLKPRRTFAEVEQPASPFVFRINEDGEPALYEADNGEWKIEAIENIFKFLTGRCIEIPVYR
jgi:hypothetical protein